MAKIEILESAQRELEAIAELHMNLVGPNSARKITDRILDSLSRLERFPLSGSLPRDAELLKSGLPERAGRFFDVGRYPQEKPERKPHGGSFRSGLFRIGKRMVQ